MTLPAGIKARTREEWTSIANKEEPIERKPIIDALKALGIDPMDYLAMDNDERVERVMAAQSEGEEEAPKKSKAKASASSASDEPVTNGKSSAGKDLAGLQATVNHLRAEVEELSALVRDAHFLIRVLVQSDARLKGNARDEDLQGAMYGKLAVARGNG